MLEIPENARNMLENLECARNSRKRLEILEKARNSRKGQKFQKMLEIL